MLSGARAIAAALLGMAVLACGPRTGADDPSADPEASAATAREQMLSVNGTELFVKVIGDGAPVLLVHGGPMLDHGTFLPHLEPLADDFQLILYDQRLQGRSAATVAPDTVRLATLVDDIEAIRVALDVGPVHLLAHSFGGLQAMSYAIRHGENLRSLVLLDSMAASSAEWREEEAALAVRISEADRAELAALRTSEEVVAREPSALAELLRLSFSWQFHDRSLADRLELYIPDDYADRSARFGAIMVDLESFDLHERLESVAVPTLILYGEAEAGTRLGGAAIHDRLPESQFVEIESAGHFPFVEQPQRVLEVLVDFLSSH